MPLHPDMIYASFRLIGDVSDSRLATGRRRGVIGTGFFVTVPSLTDRAVRYGYAITAHHVIDGQTKVEIEVPNPFGNSELYEPQVLGGWEQPLAGVDLAIASFDHRNEDQIVYAALELERQVLPPDQLPLLGANVHYIGFFEPLNRVMARSGTIGAIDQEGIDLGEYEYTAHLVDCRSYNGFSGSPCFVETRYAGLTPTRPNLPLPSDWLATTPLGEIQYFAFLCGIFTCHVESPNPGGTVSRYGVGTMLRSQEIWRALMTDEMQKQRADEDARLDEPASDSPRVEKVHSGGKSMSDDEFARFEELARQLANTPKPRPDEDAS